MSRLDHPREKDIPTNYWNQIYREYALLEAVREAAVQLSKVAAELSLIRDLLERKI